MIDGLNAEELRERIVAVGRPVVSILDLLTQEELEAEMKKKN